MVKAIIVTEENKEANNRLFINKNIGDIYVGLPSSYNGVNKIEGAYSYRLEFHDADGWFEVVKPTIDTNTHYLGDIYFDSDNNVFTYNEIAYTIEELEEKAVETKKQTVQNFLNSKKSAGAEIFNDFELRITSDLIGMPTAEVQVIVSLIDNVLYKPLNLVKTGDFASAMFLFAASTAPTNEFLLPYWNELKTTTEEYYTNNYPTDPI